MTQTCNRCNKVVDRACQTEADWETCKELCSSTRKLFEVVHPDFGADPEPNLVWVAADQLDQLGTLPEGFTTMDITYLWAYGAEGGVNFRLPEDTKAFTHWLSRSPHA